MHADNPGLYGTNRNALERDLAKLGEQGLLDGKEALVAAARHSAEMADNEPDNPTKLRLYFQALKDLGIGLITTIDPEDPFDQFLNSLQDKK